VAPGVDNIYLQSNTTAGDDVYGPSIAWSRVSGGTRRKLAIVSKQTGSDDDDVGMAIFTNPGPGDSSMVERLLIEGDGVFDFKSNPLGITNVGASGNDWTQYALTLEEGRNGDIISTVSNTNSAGTSDAEVHVKIGAGGTGGAKVKFIQGDGDGTAGDMAYQLYYDGNGLLELYSWDTDGSATGAAIWRVADEGAVMTLNNDHGANFDYVCDGCGRAEIDSFECCGTVAWHDDVLALREMTLNREGLEHMAKIGVMEISTEADGSEWVGINLQPAQHFTWSAMHQMYGRINELEAKLEALGV
jgi:hypothetical protein